jgi:hypothetical protein
MNGRSMKILIGLGVIVVILGTLYGVSLARSKARLRAAYAALEQDGRPMDASAVLSPEVPDAQNAAVFYQRAAAMLRAQTAGNEDLLERLVFLSRALYTESVKPDKIARQKREVAELKRLIERDIVASALAVIEQGTQCPACRLDRHDHTVLDRDLPVVKDMRSLATILAAKVRLEAEGGRPRRAWDLALTQLRFADALRGDAVSHSQWDRRGMINGSCRTIQTLCETAPPDESHCRAAEGLLQDLDDVDPLVRALDADRLLIGEWLFGLPTEELYKTVRGEALAIKDGNPGIVHRLEFRMTTFRPRFITDHAAYLQLMRKSVQLLQGPFIPREAESRREIDELPRRHWLTGKLASMFGPMKDSHCHMAATVRITRAGLALLEYGQAHGAFPPTLETLGLGGLVDPYTEKPLLYRAEPDGFVVYSVGEDLNDNGGAPRRRQKGSDSRHTSPEYDLLWRFPRTAGPAAGGDT